MFQLWKMDLSLILSQDYIFCLEPGMVTMNKKKTWPNAALCKVVSSRKKKKTGFKSRVLSGVCDNSI